MTIKKMRPIKFSLLFKQSESFSNKLRQRIFRAINKAHIGKEQLGINENATEEHKEAHHKIDAVHTTTIDFFTDEHGNFHPVSLRFEGKVYNLEEKQEKS